MLNMYYVVYIVVHWVHWLSVKTQNGYVPAESLWWEVVNHWVDLPKWGKKKKHEEDVISFTWMIKITLPPQQKYTSYRTLHLILKRKQANKNPPRFPVTKRDAVLWQQWDDLYLACGDMAKMRWLPPDDEEEKEEKMRGGRGWWKKAGNQISCHFVLQHLLWHARTWEEIEASDGKLILHTTSILLPACVCVR